MEDEGDEFSDNYGTVDPSLPSSNKFCGACGANFHCRVGIYHFLIKPVFTR